MLRLAVRRFNRASGALRRTVSPFLVSGRSDIRVPFRRAPFCERGGERPPAIYVVNGVLNLPPLPQQKLTTVYKTDFGVWDRNIRF
jgi:hypothetical protein